MKLGEKQELFSLLVAEYIIWCNGQGYGVRVQEWRRTLDQQRLYYLGLNVGDDGETVKGRKLSKTMKSKHLEGLAVDLYFTKHGEVLTLDAYPEDLRVLAEKWHSLHPRCRNLGYSTGFDWPHHEFS